MAAKVAYVILESITRKEGFTHRDTREPQTKYGLKCTGKSGATVWFNLFSDPEIENTILRDFEVGQGMKVTFLQSGDKGQFKNVVGLTHAQVTVEKKMSQSGGADQDKIMMQACLKAAGCAVPDELSVVDSISQFIWDVAEDLFLKLNGRRYGATSASDSPREASGKVDKPATAEMTKDEAESLEPSNGASGPGRPDVEDEEIPF